MDAVMSVWVAYLALAMRAWAGLPDDCEGRAAACRAWELLYVEPPDAAGLRYDQIAGELAREAWTREGSATTRLLRALDLAAVGYEESKLHRLVDDGTCNAGSEAPLWVQRRVKKGWCDFGRAFGIWQMWPGTIRDVAPWRPSGDDLVGNRALDVSIAWDLRARRPMAWTTWPRAESRAASWRQKHPLP